MPAEKIILEANAWTKIVDNKTESTIVNVSQWPIMVIATETDAAPDLTSVGLPIESDGRFLKESHANWSYATTPSYVWAMAIGGKKATVFVETS